MVAPDRMVSIPNTVDVDEFEGFPRDASIEERFGSRFTIGYLGGFDRHRGLDTLVEGFAQIAPEIPEAHLLLVGTGATRRGLEAGVRARGLADRVSFEGWQDYKLFPSYVRACKVCTIPHRKSEHTDTTIPHKLFHYMLLERPVLASDCLPIARILEETLARIELGDTGTLRATLPSGEVILARTLVLALGPWTDEVRAEMGLPARDLVGGTKGVHIEFASDRLPLRHALALRHPDDRRVMFWVPEPERSRVLVGTTDTETDESPDALTVGAEDVAYLLRAVQHLFPALGLGDEDIVDRWVGVRPLLQQEGSASSRSREHGMIREGAVLTIAGGKLTTYRDMAEEAVDLIGEALGRALPPCRTAVVPLPVGSWAR